MQKNKRLGHLLAHVLQSTGKEVYSCMHYPATHVLAFFFIEDMRLHPCNGYVHVECQALGRVLLHSSLATSKLSDTPGLATR